MPAKPDALSGPSVAESLRPSNRQWVSRAACLGMNIDIWFSSDAASTEAKLICGECAVRVTCLDYAISNQEMHGIWGGLTTPERIALACDRNAQAPEPGGAENA